MYIYTHTHAYTCIYIYTYGKEEQPGIFTELYHMILYYDTDTKFSPVPSLMITCGYTF